MNDLFLFNLILIFLIIISITKYTSLVVRINTLIWIIMLLFPYPSLLHIIHLIGSFQIITGWLWIEQKDIKLYMMLLFMVWVLFILRGECIVNDIIQKKNKTYNTGFSNKQILFGIPIIILLTCTRLYFNILE